MITTENDGLVVHAAARSIKHRGDTLSAPFLTCTLSSPMEGIIRVRLEHFMGGIRRQTDYSRITTKSNTFTVYYRVQALKNPPGVNAAQWTEGQGVILGDYRGSTSQERYIDPNDTSIIDYTTASAGTPNLETHYKWRVVENTRFSP